MEVGALLAGKYRLVRQLGDGGMGTVYEARHEVLGTSFAIKVLHAELVRRPGLVERFMREAHVAAKIQSPHVVSVFDVDRTADGNAYIVMELLAGEPLSRTLDRERRLAPAVAVGYTLQILSALEIAHGQNVVHRDLKPDNVYVTPSPSGPVLKLIDFGIAKLRSSDPGTKNLTAFGQVMGTPEYMAPEQAFSTERADARADIYALGVLLYEMLAGSRPATGEDAHTVAGKVHRGEVIPLVHAAPDVPGELAGLVHRAMAPRPEMRFQSAAEMAAALRGLGLVANLTPTPGAAASTVLARPLVSQAPMAPGAPITGPAAPQRTAPPDPVPAYSPAPPAGYSPAPPPGHTPVYYAHSPSAPSYESPPAARRRRSVLPWLIVLSLLLGGGGTAAYLVSQQEAPAPTPNIFGGPTTPPVVPTEPTVAPPVTPTTPTVTGPLPTLVVGNTVTPPAASTTKPTPSTAPSTSARPSADAAAPGPGPGPTPNLPFPLPSGLPSFPIPFPSAIPLPSGFPPIPSAFPLPPFPPPPPPQ